MKILVLVSNPKELLELLPWGRWLCRQDSELILICLGGKLGEGKLETELVRNDTEDKLVHLGFDSLEEGEKLWRVRGEESLKQLKAELGSEDLARSFLISGVSGRSQLHSSHEDLSEVLEDLLLDHLVLRIEGKEFDHSRMKVLVPVSGTKHARGFGELIQQFPEEVSISLMHVVPEGSWEELELGQEILKKTVKLAGISHTKPNLLVRASSRVRDAILDEASLGYDLILVGNSRPGVIDKILTQGIDEALLKNRDGFVTAVLNSQSKLFKTQNFFDRLLKASVPQLDREQRLTLFDHLHQGSQGNYDFVSLIVLSTGIAALGLMQNSVAIIIGAMLVAPLMTPMLGTGLGLVQGNQVLVKRGMFSVLSGFCLSLILGYCLGRFLPYADLTPEILARTKPNLLDLLVALLSGVAAAYSTARPGLMGALPGVAIAAALVPPIASSGICLALSLPGGSLGAATLFGTNLVAIIFASSTTFYFMGIRPYEKESQARLWARRGWQSLLVVSVVLAFPLATELLSGFGDPSGGELRKIQSLMPGDVKVIQYNPRDVDLNERHIVELGFQELPDRSRLAEIEKIIRQVLGQEIRLQIRASLILETDSSTGENSRN